MPEAGNAGSRFSLADLPWDRLHAYRKQLQEEELRTSFWRRIIQGRLDLLDAELSWPIEPDRLARVLRDGDSAEGPRTAFRPLTSEQPFPAIGEMDDLWTWSFEHPATQAQRDHIRQALMAVEKRMSDYREGIHRNLDATTREIIRRYRDDPGLVRVILPAEEAKSVDMNGGLQSGYMTRPSGETN